MCTYKIKNKENGLNVDADENVEVIQGDDGRGKGGRGRNVGEEGKGGVKYR